MAASSEKTPLTHEFQTPSSSDSSVSIRGVSKVEISETDPEDITYTFANSEKVCLFLPALIPLAKKTFHCTVFAIRSYWWGINMALHIFSVPRRLTEML